MGLTPTDQDLAAWRGWAVPAGLAAAALALQAAGLAVPLRYERVAIAAGEISRLVAGHLVHLGWNHLLMNLAGLLLVWILVGSAFSTRQWLFVLAVSIAAIDAGFWWLSPELDWYVGLSGILHAILVAGALAMLLQSGSVVWIEALVLLVLVAGKVTWEQIAGPVPGSEATAGGKVVVDAHLYGAAAGALATGFVALWKFLRDRD